MNLKKITTCAALVCLLIFSALCAGCGGIELVHYNGLAIIEEGTPRNIEGSYAEEMDMDEFETLSSLAVRQSLPEAYQSETVSANAQYDKDGKIINITCGIGQEDNGYPVSISVFSTELWSESGYSPVDDMYGSNTDDLDITTIDQTATLFYHYDDNQQENKLGYDVYIAQFKLKGLNVYVESRAMAKGDFEQFVTSMIAKAHNLD